MSNVKTGKVNCDTRVSLETKRRLNEIATVLGVKRSDVQRAAFNRYISAFDAGLIKGDIDAKA